MSRLVTLRRVRSAGRPDGRRSHGVAVRGVGWMLLALMVALWLASTLGQVHRVVHWNGLYGGGPNGLLNAGRIEPSLSGASRGAARDRSSDLAVRQGRNSASAMPAGVPSATASASALTWRPIAALLSALFGDHVDADCRLYDQLAGAAAVLSVPLMALPVVLPTARLAFFEGEYLARWVALFDARGPPPTR